MPLSLLNHSALALFAQRTRIPTSARSIGFCAIWVCISSSSSSPKKGKLWRERRGDHRNQARVEIRIKAENQAPLLCSSTKSRKILRSGIAHPKDQLTKSYSAYHDRSA